MAEAGEARGGDSAGATDRIDFSRWIILVIGVGAIGNALWMLGGPMHWYTDLPAAVPDTGPFNSHFVRDIGCAFLTIGAALCWAFFSPRFRFPLVATAALFLTAHAVLHAYDTLRGALDHDHWLQDLPGVYIPGILLPILAFRIARQDCKTGRVQVDTRAAA